MTTSTRDRPLNPPPDAGVDGATKGLDQAVPDSSATGRPSAADEAPSTPTLPSAAVAAIAIAAMAKLAVHLLTNGQYGYHRDEVYYLAAGRHPALGYVDFPPITPLLARLDELLLGDSPWTLRLVPALVGAGLVVLVALIAREVGGGRKAQALAAVATATCFLLLGANWLFQTVTFDLLWWVAALLVFARLLRTDNPRLWLAIGALLGLGLETKLTIAGLGVGLTAALLLTPLRSHLRTRWPWLGLLVAVVLVAPNLAWQQANQWPTLDFLRSHGDVIRSGGEGGVSINFDSGGVLAFLAFQPLLIGVVTLPLWAMGWYFLFRQRRYRPLGVAALATFLLYLPVGKAYYPGPLIPVLLAAGCVQFEAWVARRWRRATAVAAAAMVLQAVLAAPLLLPVVPQASLARFGLDAARKDLADTVGWPELVGQVVDAYRALPPAEQEATAILAANYGEAGAIDLFGPAAGLPSAISPHLTFWYWKPAHVEASTFIAVGFPEARMRRLFANVTVLDTIHPVDGVQSEEVGRSILLCREPVVSLDVAWAAMRALD